MKEKVYIGQAAEKILKGGEFYCCNEERPEFIVFKFNKEFL